MESTRTILFDTNVSRDLVDFGEVEAVRKAGKASNVAIVAATAVVYEILRLPLSDRLRKQLREVTRRCWAAHWPRCPTWRRHCSVRSEG